MIGCSATQQVQLSEFNSNSYVNDDNLVTPEQRIIMGKKIEGQWWDLFQSPDLNNTMREAFCDNYDIKSAQSKIQQANQSVKSMQGNWWPQVSILANAGRQKYGVALFGPLTLKVPPFTYYELGPSLSWNIDLFGTTRYSVQQLEALRAYQEHNLDATYINLTSNIAAKAVEVATVRAEIAATHNIIAEDKKTLELLLKSYKSGTHTKMDLLNARAQLESDEALLPPLQQRLSIAKHSLAILVGKAPAHWHAPDFELDSFTLPSEIPVQLPSDLIKNRPDILAAQQNLNAASAALGIANANLYPSLIITANTLQEALTPGGLFKAVNNAWAMAAGITAPIFTGGTLRAEKRKAEYAYQDVLSQYKQTILLAFQQVADALTALANDSQALEHERLALETAQQALAVAYERFKVGTTGLLQVQDQQRNLARAQINYIQAKGQQFNDTVQLFVALGGNSIRCKN